MDQTTYYQGEYAGPLTQRAMDYDGHLVIGVQISDPAPDGSCFFITLDQHMQVCIIPVLASSISPYEPAEPPPEPECTAADLADTRKNLEWLLKLQIDHGISSIGDLRACALTMSDLADVIELQDKSWTVAAPGSAPARDGNWPKIRQYVSMTDEDVSGSTGSVCQEEICGHTVFNDEGEPVGWVDIDLSGGTVSDDSIDPDYAEDVR